MPNPLCVVVGAGVGIGLSVARRFEREGFRVALLARRINALKEYTETFRHERAFAFQVDAGDEISIRTAFNEIHDQLGPTEVLVYNVAEINSGTPASMDIHKLMDDFKTNVGGALLSAQRVIPQMKAQGHGTILFTGGGLALNPNPAYSSLAVGKAALRSLTYSLGAELESDGIHVATVTVNGFVKPRTFFDPDKIAECYWHLHSQAPGAWQREIIYQEPV
jgi:NAD(P)-dependent dehydrogenase (short-subunit alcohol dehydrogenase family)